MKTSAAGIDLIKRFEGCRLAAYLCPGGIATIGYGHTATAKLKQTITQQKAEELLRVDLVEREKTVAELVKVPIQQHQFDALVSLTYNIGIGNFKLSTLLKKLNAGNVAGASGQFLVWNRARGEVLPGLDRRRKAEREMFDGA